MLHDRLPSGRYEVRNRRDRRDTGLVIDIQSSRIELPNARGTCGAPQIVSDEQLYVRTVARNLGTEPLGVCRYRYEAARRDCFTGGHNGYRGDDLRHGVESRRMPRRGFEDRLQYPRLELRRDVVGFECFIPGKLGLDLVCGTNDFGQHPRREAEALSPYVIEIS